MNESLVTITITSATTSVVFSAANEVALFYDDERELSRAPSEADAELLSDTLDPLIADHLRDELTWSFPRSMVTTVLALIPACLVVHDEEELQIRCMRGRVEFEAAQAELLNLLSPYSA